MTGEGIVAHVEVVQGEFHLDASVRAASGEVLAVVGPNGSGKSTLLRCVAGLRAIDRGRIALGAWVVDDPGSGVFVFPESRGVAMVFQDHLLFPRMDLTANVAFGLRARRVARSDAETRATAWLGRVGLTGLERARPNQVSGGQAQRAALARALVTDPAVLLLDEPLAALDVGTRSAVRRELRQHLQTFPGATLMVTHDAVDAMALADRLVVLEDGRITQEGTLPEVTSAPRTPYVAELMGTNLLAGAARGIEVTLEVGGPQAAAPRVIVGEEHTGPVLVLVRPSSVTLHVGEPAGSQRNRWRGTVVGLDPHGDRVRVRLDGQVPLVAEVTRGAVAELGLVEGAEVWAAVKATDVSVLER